MWIQVKGHRSSSWSLARWNGLSLFFCLHNVGILNGNIDGKGVGQYLEALVWVMGIGMGLVYTLLLCRVNDGHGCIGSMS